MAFKSACGQELYEIALIIDQVILLTITQFNNGIGDHCLLYVKEKNVAFPYDICSTKIIVDSYPVVCTFFSSFIMTFIS